MNKKITKLIALTATVGILSSNAILQSYAQDTNNQTNQTQQIKINTQKLSLGSSLNQEQIYQTIKMLTNTSVNKEDITIISGVEVNKYLGDGSNESTDVYSSAVIEEREDGYGVQVQILTPTTIKNVSSDTYKNAAITSGAKDVLIKIASLVPVTGEGALVGVYSIYDAHGNGLNKENIQVAQQELVVASQIVESKELNDTQVNEILTSLKLKIAEKLSENKELSDKEIEKLVDEEIQAYIKKNNVKISDDTILILKEMMKQYAKLELGTITDQLEQSNRDNFTYQQAIDFYNSIDKAVTGNTFGGETYDENKWIGITEEGIATVLQYGENGPHYAFKQIDNIVYITIAETLQSTTFEEDKGDEIYRLAVDKNTRLVLSVQDSTSMREEYSGELNKDNLLNYLGSVMYPGSEELQVVLYEESDFNDGVPSYNVIVETKLGDKTNHDRYRVFTNGSIDLINNYDLSGYPVDFPELEVEESESQDSTEESTESQEESSETKEQTTYDIIPYDNNKDKKLEDMMSKFGGIMGQDYVKYTLESPGTMFGPVFPNEVLTKVAIDGQPVTAEWSTDGQPGDSDILVVGAYNNFDQAVANLEGGLPHFYLFAIVNGKPVVLYSQQNQGMPDGRIHFSMTQNPDLQKGFETIMLGQ